MKVLTMFLTFFVWTEMRKVHSGPVHSDEENEEDFEKNSDTTRREEDEGEPLNEMDFYDAKFINTSSLDLRTKKEDGDPLFKAGLFQGDILLDNISDTHRANFSGRNAIRHVGARWPDAIVPYSMSDAFDRYERIKIARGISEYHKKTCIRFVPRTSAHKDYVYFMKGDGCYSHAGRVGGAQNVSLGGGCLHFSAVVHELMHALGFWHEQSRGDRDEYVTIRWDNIQKGKESIFQKFNWDYIQDLNESYDYHSVMHYDPYAFAKSSDKPTIEPKEKGKTIGQVHGFSAADLRKINKLYHCNRTKEEEEEVNGTGSECADTDGRCEEWAKRGECDQKPDWMRPNCMKACGLCEFSMGCNDQSDKCPEWSNQSLCDTKPKFMKIFCLKSCKVCPKLDRETKKKT